MRKRHQIMSIFIKNEEQIEKMRVACRITGETLNLLEKHIRAGITTGELDAIAAEYIRSQGAVPSFLGYNGYPANICVSVNEEVIHGIGGIRKLNEGDIVSVDVGAYINKFHGDAARTFAVGEITDEHKRLIEVTKQSFFEGIKYAKEGHRLNEICAAIGDYIEANGFTAVKEFVGHGVGAKLHEAPQVPNYRQDTSGPKLARGMTLAIEPMVNAGRADIRILSDMWTVVTGDRKYSAHYENTVLITDGEPEILTLV